MSRSSAHHRCMLMAMQKMCLGKGPTIQAFSSIGWRACGTATPYFSVAGSKVDEKRRLSHVCQNFSTTSIRMERGSTERPSIRDLKSPDFWDNLTEKDVEWNAFKKTIMKATDGENACQFLAERYDDNLRHATLGKELCDDILESKSAIVEAIRGPSTVQDVLESYIENGLLKYFKIGIGSSKTCYVASRAVDFRHQGILGERPTSVYLQSPSLWEPMVYIYFGSSGTGKSVELAASAYLRNADIALVWSSRPEVKDCPEYTDPHDRERHALVIMSQIVEEMITDNPKLVEMLGKAQKAVSDGKMLRLVFGLDEMAALSTFVHALIRDPPKFAAKVNEVLGLSEDIDVNFSVSGTGSSRGTVGSMPDNLRICAPSAVDNAESVYDEMRKEDGYWNLPKWGYISNRFPILSVLIEHNARMMSIAMKAIRERSTLVSNAEESTVIERVLRDFVATNGLSSFQPRDLPLVAACALAVHLFQEPVVFQQKELEERTKNRDYGLQFDLEYCLLKERVVTIQSLVQRAGLLVPAALLPGWKVERPFKLDPAMQLLCVALLSNSDMSRSLDMLSSSRFSFEMLATDLVKSAIAASMVVKADKRSSIGHVLEKSLGFFVEESWQLERSPSGIRTKSFLDELSMVTATRIFSQGQDNPAVDTYFHEVEAEIVKVEDLKSDYDTLLQQVPDGEIEAGKGVLFDKEASRRLLDMSPSLSDNKSERCFVPPVASVACGNSSLANGYVTFVGTSNESQTTQYTIMIQARDYFGSSKIESRDVVMNAEVCQDENLDMIFGNKRLFCVASRQDKLTLSKAGRIERNFVGFAVDKCQILSELMGALDGRRDPSQKSENKGGNLFQQIWG